MDIDWDNLASYAPAALSLVAVVGILVTIVLVRTLRQKTQRSQSPGSLTLQEVRNRLDAVHLSLADKGELASMFDGQRIRWSCTLGEAYRSRGTLTALCIGEPYGGQFFFDPVGADVQRVERTPAGARMVVEGTLRVDLDHNLLTLDAPVIRADLLADVGGGAGPRPGT